MCVGLDFGEKREGGYTYIYIKKKEPGIPSACHLQPNYPAEI